MHTDPISVPGWTGAGYIIFDPEDGSGAYKITGGGNGSWQDIDSEDAASGLGTAVSITSVVQSIFGFLAKTSVTLGSIGPIKDFATAIRQVGSILTGVSAIVTGAYVFLRSDSITKAVLGTFLDLFLTIVSGLLGKAVFSLVIGGAAATGTLPLIAAVGIAIGMAILMTLIKNWLIERLVSAAVNIRRILTFRLKGYGLVT